MSLDAELLAVVGVDAKAVLADTTTRAAKAAASLGELERLGMREFALRTPDGHRIVIGERLG